MKLKYAFITIVLLLLSVGSSDAIYNPQTTYPTQTEFDASGDAPICEVVTDGCNEWEYVDGEKGDPIKLCKLTADFEYKWSCEKYQDNILFLTGGGEIVNFGSKQDPLSTNDRNFYETIQTRLEEKYQARVMNVLGAFQKITNKLDPIQESQITEKFVSLIDAAISELLMSYPQDIALPAKANNMYLMLSMLKFEVQLIGYNGGNEVYSCNTEEEFQVYRNDYTVDDMAFSVNEDEIHVSDGEYFLPNYVGQKVTSTSGEKYEVEETNSNTDYIFLFDGDTLTIADDEENILHACSK